MGLETEIPTCNYIETNMLNQHNGDKIIGINVRGLKANFSSLEEFMNKQNNPQEIMVLTEIFNATRPKKITILTRTHSHPPQDTTDLPIMGESVY